jgi:hypothetical protein
MISNKKKKNKNNRNIHVAHTLSKVLVGSTELHKQKIILPLLQHVKLNKENIHII